MRQESYFILAEKLPQYWTIANTPVMIIAQMR